MSGKCRSTGFSTACQGLRRDGNSKGLPDSQQDFPSRSGKEIPSRRAVRYVRRTSAWVMLHLPAVPPPTCRISWDRFTPTTRETRLAEPILIKAHLLGLPAL